MYNDEMREYTKQVSAIRARVVELKELAKQDIASVEEAKLLNRRIDNLKAAMSNLNYVLSYLARNYKAI